MGSTSTYNLPNSHFSSCKKLLDLQYQNSAWGIPKFTLKVNSIVTNFDHLHMMTSAENRINTKKNDWYYSYNKPMMMGWDI